MAITILSGLSFSTYASDRDEVSNMINLLKDIESDTASYQRALMLGEQRIMLCKYCHGKNGISKKDKIPNLAAQNSEYLLRQFELFSNKNRKDKVMTELARNLSQSEKVNIALYYSSQASSKGQSYKFGNKIEGKDLFKSKCASCHGNDGYGNKDLPRLAGQTPAYLIKTLREYKNGASMRPNSPMQSIAAKLSDNQIKSLISYVSELN